MRAAAVLLLLCACDDFGALSRDAHCRATHCDGGAAGDGGGGVPDAGPAPYRVLWKSGNAFVRAIGGGGDTVILSYSSSGSGYWQRFHSTGSASEAFGNRIVTSAFVGEGGAVLCGDGFVDWVDPQTTALLNRIQFAESVATCNIYPTAAGPTFSAWGSRDAGGGSRDAGNETELWVASGLADGGMYLAPTTIGTCTSGAFTPQRIRYSPFGGDGVVTGIINGSCSYQGAALPSSGGTGFVARAPNFGAVPPTGFLVEVPPPVSEGYGNDHFVAWRAAGTLSVGRLSGSSTDPRLDARLLTGNREANELVAADDAGLLLVGAVRRGAGTATDERDVSVTRVDSTPAGPDWLLDAGGDQVVAGAAWLSGPRVIAIAGNCLGLGGVPPPPSDLCTGDGGSGFLILVDPARL